MVDKRAGGRVGGGAKGRATGPGGMRSAIGRAAGRLALPLALVIAGGTALADDGGSGSSAPPAADGGSAASGSGSGASASSAGSDGATADAGSDRTAGSGGAASASTAGGAAGPSASGGSDDHAALVKRGEYLAIAGDCAACHTGPDMKPFSGGLVMQTPFGGISTPNITPDDETGIGKWTVDDFWRALHLGVGKDGEYLYPAMPYTSYTKVRRDDVEAIFAYLQSLDPVHAPRKPTSMGFPFNIREGLAAWNLMFFQPGVYQANDDWSDQVNRGAYLVQGLAHCGECHSPRNVAGAVTDPTDLSGGKILGQPYAAPDIAGGTLHEGIADWSVATIVDYLKTGAAKGKGSAFGPMEDAVEHSFSKLTDDDLKAIAAYLKTVPDMAPKQETVVDTRKKQGSKVYMDNCAACHQSSGQGIAGVIPPLDGNGAVTTPAPDNVVTAVIGGLQGHGTYGHMPAFGAQFDDRQVADLVNFVRTAWSNDAPANATPAMVARLRGQIAPTGAASEVARAFGCPAVTETGAKDAVASPGPQIMQGFHGVTNAEMDNRVHVLVNEVKAKNPKASDAQVVNTLLAAYCPIVAADDGLTTPEKKDRLDTFVKAVDSALGRGGMQDGDRILVEVPLPQPVVDQIDRAAQAAQESRRDWLETAIAREAAQAALAEESDGSSDAGSGSGDGNGGAGGDGGSGGNGGQ